MHQMLSYESDVRGNSSSDLRDFVPKRTCLSVVLIIVLTSFVLGYLLGNFITERHYVALRSSTDKTIKSVAKIDTQHASNSLSSSSSHNELSQEDYALLEELHDYESTKSKLLSSTRKLSKIMQRNENYLSSSLNSDIFNKYVSCTQDVPPNTSIESSLFIEQLVDDTAARQRDCLRIIQVIIDNHLSK